MDSADLLYEIFNRHLMNPIREEESSDDLIFTVVVEYMLHLMQQGNIPQSQMDYLEIDLKEEVAEIYLKVTYGYLSLQSYREAKNLFAKLRKKAS